MTGHEIRQRFLDFFAERGHTVVRSSSLVPANDPTLLFTNAGMNQFKDVFTGNEKRAYSRAASSQKCVRAGGKHNDLENVGYTRRHQTFFEMLGNFSFGDYFKAEAIDFAWDLITREYGLPKDKLYVTVFREDDEAEELWQKVTGIPKSRIFRLDEKDNFWQMGETGPCGPCSEIFYDFGVEAAEPGRENEQFPDDGGGRFVEIWNLVFMQFDRDSSGKLTRLPRPSIDTGMGLERISTVLQGKISNYETDLINPIIENAGQIFGVTPGEDPRVDTVLRIAADHARASAFLVHDGVVPSNEGRGYVLRKIMRRALRNVRMIGVEDPFLYKMTGFVAELMGGPYPEMLESIQRVARVVKDEEHRYASTFLVAERVFNDAIKQLNGQAIPGALSFKLYDTYGLALDEQEDMAREHGLTIDRAAFDAEMDHQRERARASWKGAAASAAEVYVYAKDHNQDFDRDQLTLETWISKIIVDGSTLTMHVDAGQQAELVLQNTPFYPESGGQVGDQGTLYVGDLKVADVLTVYRPIPGLIAHQVRTYAPLNKGDTVCAEVAVPLRDATRRNHTATHLLHASLRQVLGTHVKQAGSVVDPGRLRFDFSHYAALDRAEIEEVERLTNQQILKNTAVTTDILPLDQAIATGAMALFGEKYGESVRVVTVPGFSRELCGGTHVQRTGDIGVCKIIYEGSISAGVRRIEAVTGEGALRQYQETTGAVRKIAELVQSGEPDLLDHVEKLLANERALEKQVEQLKNKLAQAAVGQVETQARDFGAVKVVAARLDGMDRPQMRALADALRNKWKSAVVVLAAAEDGSVSIISAVTKDLTARVHAGKLASAVAQAVGGKGGGRPDMAEAGGKDASALNAALDAVYQDVEGKL